MAARCEGAGNVTVSGTLNWYDGTITGAGNLTIASGGNAQRRGRLDHESGRPRLGPGARQCGDRELDGRPIHLGHGQRHDQQPKRGQLHACKTARADSRPPARPRRSPTRERSPSRRGADTFELCSPAHQLRHRSTSSPGRSTRRPRSPTRERSLSPVPSTRPGRSRTRDGDHSGSLAATAAISNSATVTVSSGATLSDTGAAYQQTAGTTTSTGLSAPTRPSVSPAATWREPELSRPTCPTRQR